MTRKRIVLAEDEKDLRETLQQMLEEAGYHVLAVEDGEEALWAIEVNTPHLVLTDREMPYLDGVKLAETTALLKIPTILMSGIEEPKEHKAQRFFLKPFNIDYLCKAIEELTE